MLNILLTSILVVVGVVLLLLEMFLIPGFGIAGTGGFLCLTGAVVWAYIQISHLAGHIVLAVSVALSLVSIVIFFRSRVIEKLGLDKKLDDRVEMPKAGKHMEEMKS